MALKFVQSFLGGEKKRTGIGTKFSILSRSIECQSKTIARIFRAFNSRRVAVFFERVLIGLLLFCVSDSHKKTTK